MNILLVAMPRSGSTWVGKILDSHPDTLYRHEPDRLRLNAIPLLADPAPDAAACSVLQDFVAALSGSRDPRVCGKLPLFPKSYLSGLGSLVFRGSVYLNKLSGGRLPLVSDLSRHRPPPVLVWKSIESTGRAGLIAGCLPDWRLIHLIRHPCGQIASVLRGEELGRFSDDCRASRDWGVYTLLAATPQAARHGLDLAAFKGMDDLQRLAWRWALFNEKAIDELSGQDNAMLIRYEDICRDPAAAARRMLALAGLEPAVGVARFLASSSAGGSDAYYGVRRDSTAESGRWRQRLAAWQVRCIRDVVRQTRAGELYTDDFAD